jgi:alkylation response protein AidB-like acyl-CoA dehydrogenase
VRFDLSEGQVAWQAHSRAFAQDLPASATAVDAVARASRVGLLHSDADLLSLVIAAEEIALRSAACAVAYAMHVLVAHALRGTSLEDGLRSGKVLGAVALATDVVPVVAGAAITGRASWVAPATAGGVAILGARAGKEVRALTVGLNDPGVLSVAVTTAGLSGLPWAHLDLQGAQGRDVGATAPIMTRARLLMAGVGLGIGSRAVHEALAVVRAAGVAASGEQTAQGLLADAATELDAARLLTWTAAGDATAVTLGRASVAKLAATEAAQRAVAGATQVVGADSFARDHVVEHLARDVRALELFAGRTEALRAAVAEEML